MVRQPVEQRVHAREAVEDVVLQFLDHRAQVTRVGQQDVLAAQLGAQQHVHREGEDMVEGQRTDKAQLVVRRPLRQARLVPGLTLQHVGHDVAMQQHRTLGHAGGAAGVLQHGDVVHAQLHRLVLLGGILAQRIVETHRTGQVVGGHQLLHVAHHVVHHQALDQPHAVAHGRHHHVLDVGMPHAHFQRMGKVLDDEDRLGAGILELVFEFTRGIERIDVDQHHAGPHDGHGGNRILQDVGHHHRHAVTTLQADLLQIDGQRLAGLVEFGKRHVAAHHGEGRAVGKLRERLLQQVHQRTVGAGVDVHGHAWGVFSQPGAAVNKFAHAMSSSCPAGRLRSAGGCYRCDRPK